MSEDLCNVRVICGTRSGDFGLAEITYRNAIADRVDAAGIEELRAVVVAAFKESFPDAPEDEIVTIVALEDPDEENR